MLTAASTTQLVSSGFAAYSTAALRILGYSMAILVGLLVCYWGYNQIANIARDKSARIHVPRFGTFYLRSVPFKGYKRFRSERWNMEHMA